MSDIVGKPAHLLRLASGDVLCTYGHRAEPWSIRAVISRDEGCTWDTDDIVILQQWADRPDMGYASSIELEPGDILTVYYCGRAPVEYAFRTEAGYRPGSTAEGVLWKRWRRD